MPFHPFPRADFGDDVSDSCGVDPLFGTGADFEALVAEAHFRREIILDFVPNHTSIAHPWFADSRASRASPKRNRYIWRHPALDCPSAPTRRRGTSTDPALSIEADPSLPTTPEPILAREGHDDGATLRLVLNSSAAQQNCSLEPAGASNWSVLLSTHPERQGIPMSESLALPPMKATSYSGIRRDPPSFARFARKFLNVA